MLIIIIILSIIVFVLAIILIRKQSSFRFWKEQIEIIDNDFDKTWRAEHPFEIQVIRQHVYDMSVRAKKPSTYWEGTVKTTETKFAQKAGQEAIKKFDEIIASIQANAEALNHRDAFLKNVHPLYFAERRIQRSKDFQSSPKYQIWLELNRRIRRRNQILGATIALSIWLVFLLLLFF